uniref:Uncharacterized protein n=1 Tax=Salix viminalis TaxID=40686 RepID=A0A6N2MV38_SALVM
MIGRKCAVVTSVAHLFSDFEGKGTSSGGNVELELKLGMGSDGYQGGNKIAASAPPYMVLYLVVSCSWGNVHACERMAAITG